MSKLATWSVRRSPFIVVVIACAALLIRCHENLHAKYADIGDLERAGTGSRTWFPNTLPASAVDLEVWYNIDTNGAVGRMKFDPAEREPFRLRLTAALSGEPFASAQLPMLDESDWPQCLRGSLSASDVTNCRFESFRIRGFQMILDPNGAVYFWTP
jgi:hypothetical protein